MWRRRSALCLCGIGVLEPEKEEHPTTPQIVEVHQRPPDVLVLYDTKRPQQVLYEISIAPTCAWNDRASTRLPTPSVRISRKIIC